MDNACFFMHDIAFKIMYDVCMINRGKIMHGVAEYKHAWIMDWLCYGFHARFFIDKIYVVNAYLFMKDISLKVIA